MRTILIGAWIAAAIAPAPIYQESTSDVTGFVTYTGIRKPKLINAQVDELKHDAESRGKKDVYKDDLLVGAKGELANVLVRVRGPVKGEFKAPEAPAVLDAAGYFFKPRIVALQAGQTLRLTVTGLVRCNFNVEARANRSVNVNIVKGASHDVNLPQPESAIHVKHDCCGWQEAWVHVIEHPFFAVTGADGQFRIPKLPAGTYEIEARHELFGTRVATVTVDGKKAASWNFIFDDK